MLTQAPLLNQAWLFPGQGSQYTRMGCHVWHHKLADDVLTMAESLCGLPLRDIMQHGPDSALQSPEYLEPCIVALQTAYVLLLQSKGMQPDVVAGYSLGEVAALYCAGCFSLLDALMFASERGKILARNSRKGEWQSRSVHFAEEPAALPLDGTANIFIAAYNTARDFTITGEARHIMAVESVLLKRGAVLAPVAIDGPWHSPLSADSAKETADLLKSVEFRAPVLPVCLATGGEFVRDVASIRASLSRQIDNPVRWTDTLETLWNAGVRSTLEIGPGRVLTSFVRANWVGRGYRSQFLERQGGRAIDFSALKNNDEATEGPPDSKENSWTQ